MKRGTAKQARPHGVNGRPPHQPTESNRRVVYLMAANGIPQASIATCLRIAPMTLRRHYRGELERGASEATAKVAQALFEAAISSTHPASVTAAIFWLKVHGGGFWRL